MDHNEPSLAGIPLFPQAKYVRELRTGLPASAFEPDRVQLARVPLFAGIAIAAIAAIATGWLPWLLWPVASVVIGASFACLTFVAHEGMHGGITRDKRLKHLVGWIGFLPFTVSPTLWHGWHDRVHHATANLDHDPDAYPSLAEYRASARVRFATDRFSLGGRRWRGLLSLFLGFTVQSAHQLIAARKYRTLSPAAHRRAYIETAAGIAVWASVAALVGGVAFLFVFAVPLLVANAVVMSFILTNHSLSPRVVINDPLVTGLTVTTNRWVDWATLRFGYHVEHHVFPAMSSRHAHLVRAQLVRRWPERYQSMPLVDALGALHRTARVYKDATTLFDPLTGAEFPTLMPGPAAVVLPLPLPRPSRTHLPSVPPNAADPVEVGVA
jgi:fatty acid desaturase